MARPEKTGKWKNTHPVQRVVAPKDVVKEADIEAASMVTRARRDLAKKVYLEMGPGRSLSKAKPLIVEKIGEVSDRTIENWSSKDDWVESGIKWDQDVSARETANIRELIELGHLDHAAALELVMAKGLDLLLKSNFAITSPQDARAVMTFIKQAQDVIEIKSDPTGSTQRRIQQGGTVKSADGETEVHVTLRGSRAIAALSGIEDAMRKRASAAKPPVIDVVPEQVEAVAPAQVEAAQIDVSRETIVVNPQQPAALPAPAKPFAMDVHDLARIAATEGKTFAQILEERKPKT